MPLEPWGSLFVLFSFLPLLSLQHLGCGQRYLKNPPVLTVVEPTNQDNRLLIHSRPHPLRIFGHFPTTTSTDFDLGVLRTMFGVASRYYSRVITVTEMTFISTQYPLSAGTCGIAVPQKYIKEGFDQTIIDLVVFILIESNTTETYVAAASPCIQSSRPIYGYITFNVAFLNQTNVPAYFHQYVYVTIHQLTHILGFNHRFYAHFYVHPGRGGPKLGSERVITSAGLRKMIITKSVVEYVREHFGFEQDPDGDIIGALLEDDGEKGTLLSHWEKAVYMDELMTASAWEPGLRISQLTLRLLKDTGFYYEVDLSMSEDILWGKGRGAKFAKAEQNGGPEYCQPDQRGCDYYSKYMGYCTNSEPYAGGSYLMLVFSNRSICGVSELQTNAGPVIDSNSSLTISADSRCFETDKTVTACYPATCLNNSAIEVTVGTSHVVCTKPNQLKVVGDIKFYCPKNFDVFCTVLSCSNWCNFKGLCLKGKCICNPPYFGDDCTKTCQQGQYFDPDQDVCLQNCAQGKVIGIDNVCLLLCPQGFVADSSKKCVLCDDVCQQIPKLASAVTLFIAVLLILL